MNNNIYKTVDYEVNQVKTKMTLELNENDQNWKIKYNNLEAQLNEMMQRVEDESLLRRKALLGM